MPALINTISHKTQIKRNEVFILPPALSAGD